MLKVIEEQQHVIRHLNQEILSLSKKFSRTRMTQTLLLSILMKYDPQLLSFFENEVSKLEEKTSLDQIYTSEIIILKKVLSDIKKIASKSKNNIPEEKEET